MSVGRICQRDVDYVEPDESVYAAAERMHQRAVGTLVVLDGEKKPVGIITDRDITLRVVASKRDPESVPVSEVMSAQPHTVTEETPIEDSIVLMRSGVVRRLPVVNKDGEIVGILSLDDILLLLTEEFESIRLLLARETPKNVIG